MSSVIVLRPVLIVKEFNYLGILLNRTGNFNLAIKAQADKGTRAMYEIKKKRNYHNLSVSYVKTI
jgi:hypothetical protein